MSIRGPTGSLSSAHRKDGHALECSGVWSRRCARNGILPEAAVHDYYRPRRRRRYEVIMTGPGQIFTPTAVDVLNGNKLFGSLRVASVQLEGF